MSLIGRLTEPAELRTSETGEELCALRLAVPRIARGGTREPGVVYVVVTVCGWQAREIGAAIAVGGRVAVSGRIEVDDQAAPGGEPPVGYEVMADQLELLDPPPGETAA